MATVRLQVRISSIPVGFCFESWAASFPQLVDLQYVEGEVEANLHIGEAAPSNTAFAWDRTISGVPDRRYHFTNGVWVSRHDWADRIGATMIAPAGLAEADVETWDGGEAGAVTAFTGPMWEIDERFSGRFPIGPGTLPSGTVISEGDEGGEEKHSLTLPEIPPHHHILLASQSDTGGGSGVQRLRPNATEADSDANSANAGGDPTTELVVAHNTMPLYTVALFLKKSGRTHYRA